MEFNNSVPIYIQVINRFKSHIITGKISLGQKLPSTRDLAKEISINPNTATRIYKELENMGICYKKRGLGTFITESEDIIMELKKERGKELLDAFYDGMKKMNFTLEEMIELLSIRENEKKEEV